MKHQRVRLFESINYIKKCLAVGGGLCPHPVESPREGREERRIEGGREVAWTPKIYDRSPPLVSK